MKLLSSPGFFLLALVAAAAPAFGQPRSPQPPPPPRPASPAPLPAPRPTPTPTPTPTPAAADDAPDEDATGFGRPLAGLGTMPGADFLDGRDDFKETDTPATGLGPLFNNTSCVSCHSTPSVGGSSALTVTRYGRNVHGQFDPLTAQGGTLLHASTTIPELREVIPAAANVIAQRQSLPLYGLGLIEAIDDATLIAATLRPKPPGVSGRVALITDLATGAPRIGRFGWKNQHATLLSFAADAYSNEMGITNRILPDENAPNGNTALLLRYVPVHPVDDKFDPVTQNSGIDKVANFMRLLAPPPRAAGSPAADRGERHFTDVGCAACHTPSYTTGASTLAALDHQPVPLYSDLLLHDMGPLGDGIAQSAAGTNEMRTPPLWGLRASAPYLHDGRAATIDEAIRAHAGEAAEIRERYVKMNPGDRADLLEFLRTLE